jgi:hypothetical protein
MALASNCFVMAGLVPAISIRVAVPHDRDARDKPGHDEERMEPGGLLVRGEALGKAGMPPRWLDYDAGSGETLRRPVETRANKRGSAMTESAMTGSAMTLFSRREAAVAIGAAFGAGALATGSARAELDAKAVIFKLPDQIEWKGSGGNRSAVLAGDPAKPGLYIVINKWLKGNNFSRPHFHPNDRFITVLQGTWWVGSGNKFDPNETVPMKPGTFVTHFGQQVHWDGAKDEDAVILIVGEGPATSTRVEEAK